MIGNSGVPYFLSTYGELVLYQIAHRFGHFIAGSKNCCRA